MQTHMNSQEKWPVLDFPALQDMLETLHQWLQIVEKVDPVFRSKENTLANLTLHP